MFQAAQSPTVVEDFFQKKRTADTHSTVLFTFLQHIKRSARRDDPALYHGLTFGALIVLNQETEHRAARCCSRLAYSTHPQP
jgi:hypothetical protein